MKKSILFMAVAILAGISACSEKPNAHAEFFIRGNCGMCKERIDKTIMSIGGVSKADWNVDTKMMTVDYDSTKVKVIDIEKAVAKTGHGTKSVAMDSTANANLPDCCQAGFMEEEHDGHTH